MIWHRRFVLKQQQPWTNDIYLRDYKYTNVYPDLDRGSIYIQDEIKNIEDAKDKFFRIIVYRLFNRIQTFEQIKHMIFVDKFDTDMCIDILKTFRSQGNKILTDAFLVTGTGKFKTSNDKTEIILRDVIRDDILKNLDSYYTKFISSVDAKSAHKELAEMRYVGNFLAYIILYDCVCAGIVKYNMNEWCNVGPGADKAIRYIWNDNVNNLDMIKKLRDMQDIYLDKDFPYYNNRRLTLIEIEWTLCEYSKYVGLKYKIHNSRIRFYKGVQSV